MSMEELLSEGPFYVVIMPTNKKGQGPEMNPKKVARTDYEVWNQLSLSIASYRNAEDAGALAAALNKAGGYGQPVAVDDFPATSGVIEMIRGERIRQLVKEGWSASHDDDHRNGELALAAACYAIGHETLTRFHIGFGMMFAKLWPSGWDLKWYKPGDRIRSLVKAAALLTAEIERLKRREVQPMTLRFNVDHDSVKRAIMEFKGAGGGGGKGIVDLDGRG